MIDEQTDTGGVDKPQQPHFIAKGKERRTHKVPVKYGFEDHVSLRKRRDLVK